jgi:hypothetical protein
MLRTWGWARTVQKIEARRSTLAVPRRSREITRLPW